MGRCFYYFNRIDCEVLHLRTVAIVKDDDRCGGHFFLLN
jgi:hypothetical protein